MALATAAGKKPRRVLLVGNGQFYHVGAFFKKALANLGHFHSFIDESRFFAAPSLIEKGLRRIFGKPIVAFRRFNEALLEEARSFRPNVIFVTKGSYVRPSVLEEVKSETHASFINYATDNPFNPLGATQEVAQAIPLYDLYVTPTKALLPILKRAGAQRVMWLPFGYEPTLHFPESPQTPEEMRRWEADVVFAGVSDSYRVPFLAALSKLPGLGLRLYGGYWERTSTLRRFRYDFVFGREYRLAQGRAKISLTIVRCANPGGHTMRTFEIPACGGFLLAERTPEHLELLEEDTQMACFSSPEELVEKVRYYLTHESQRRRIAQAGHRRVTQGKHTYQDRLVEILKAIDL